MATIYLSDNDPQVHALARASFPGYTGRKFRLEVRDAPINCASSWCGGSRSYFVFLNLATMVRSAEVPAQSAFDPKVDGLDRVTLPAGFACVEHSIFCGKDMGLRFYVRSENAAALLPAPVVLTREESIVLAATAGLKSSYGGVKDFRFVEARRETGIGPTGWETAKESCIRRGFLNSAGAITIEGRNAIGSTRLSAFQRADRFSAADLTGGA